MTEYVKVPREPTEEMLDAGDAPFHAALQSQREANRRAGRPLGAYGSEPVTRAVWSAMLAASPQGEGSPIGQNDQPGLAYSDQLAALGL